MRIGYVNVHHRLLAHKLGEAPAGPAMESGLSTMSNSMYL